jgi:hypothetical protein
VVNVGNFEKKFDVLFRATQKLQDFLSLDLSPIGVFTQLALKSFNMLNPNRKE